MFDKYIEIFEKELQESGLTKRTIDKHLFNIEFFLNDYVDFYSEVTLEESVEEVDSFLGDFFIRKCMWSTPAQIRSNAATFKKFYKCMENQGHMPEGTYKNLLAIIREEMPIWLDRCERYNDIDQENPFFADFF